jgi:hypothetical protein
MQYIKRLLSTLASLNYDSGSRDHLDDHLFPSYLEFAPVQNADESSTAKEYTEPQHYLLDESVNVKARYAEMNNSYPSR